MGDSVDPITYETFALWLHQALDILYDTPAIQRNPLANCFGEDKMTRLQKAQNLRKVLLHCIQTLNEANLPSSSPDWQAYRILEMRYLDSQAVNEVAMELSISKSQFFRVQARAINLLTDIVWDRYQSIVKHVETSIHVSEPDLAQTEAERLSAQAVREMVDLDHLLEELGPTIEMLSQPGGVKVSILSEQAVLLPSSNRVMLRQAVIILCGWIIARLLQGELYLKTFQQTGLKGLEMIARGQPALAQPPDDHSVDIARELIARLGGRLSLSEHPTALQARLDWSTSEQIVLVVDDDSGIPALFRRYLVGYSWLIIGAENGMDARKLIETTLPAVILLDVMMPKEDGWELLAALKQNPLTKDIPAIVCSVLTSPTLALNLGAAAYLPKPVSQQALIEALAYWSLPNPPVATGS